MPRSSKPKETPQKLEQNRLMWEIFGKKATVLITGWDPKAVQFVEALLLVASSGATILLRPGSGGGALGIAIWEGDVRHAPVWCYTAEEMDDWASLVLDAAKEGRAD